MFTVLMMLVALTGGLYSAVKETAFIHGSVETTARFLEITGQKPDRNNATTYMGTYQYAVAGVPYTLTRSQDSTNFPRSVQIAYKTADPANSDILYHGTALREVIWDIGSGVVLAVAVYFVFYALAVFGRRVGGTR